jgi:hypothetical protein
MARIKKLDTDSLIRINDFLPMIRSNDVNLDCGAISEMNLGKDVYDQYRHFTAIRLQMKKEIDHLNTIIPILRQSVYYQLDGHIPKKDIESVMDKLLASFDFWFSVQKILFEFDIVFFEIVSQSRL